MHVQILHLQRTTRVNVFLSPELWHSYSPPSSTFTAVNFSLNVFSFTFTTCSTLAGEDVGTRDLSGLNQPTNVSPPLIVHVMVTSVPDVVCHEGGLMVTAATVEQHTIINSMVVKGCQKPGWFSLFAGPWPLMAANKIQFISVYNTSVYNNKIQFISISHLAVWIIQMHSVRSLVLSHHFDDILTSCSQTH